MQDWSEAGLEGCRTGGLQEGGIHERSDVDRRSARKVRCRTGGMQDRRDAGQEGFGTGVIQVRCDAGKEL